jgi:hypothetical protein
VSALSDGTLTGLARWYTRLHILTCSRCRSALRALQSLSDRLHRLGSNLSEPPVQPLSEDRRSVVERAMDEVEKRRGM